MIIIPIGLGTIHNYSDSIERCELLIVIDELQDKGPKANEIRLLHSREARNDWIFIFPLLWLA